MIEDRFSAFFGRLFSLRSIFVAVVYYWSMTSFGVPASKAATLSLMIFLFLVFQIVPKAIMTASVIAFACAALPYLGISFADLKTTAMY